MGAFQWIPHPPPDASATEIQNWRDAIACQDRDANRMFVFTMVSLALIIAFWIGVGIA